MCRAHSAKHKLQGAKNEWNLSPPIVVIAVKSGLKIWFFSAPLTYVFSATAIIPPCMYFQLQQRAGSLCLSQAFWWARQWSSQLMMSHLNQQVGLTNTRLTESWDANKGWGWGRFFSSCNLACFCVFFSCSGGSETQCLSLDEHFHECNAESQCELCPKMGWESLGERSRTVECHSQLVSVFCELGTRFNFISF